MEQIKSIWKDIYKQWFNLEKDFSGTETAEYNPQKHFCIILPREISLNQTLEVMEKKFKFSFNKINKDLNNSVPVNIRDNKNQDYIIVLNKPKYNDPDEFEITLLEKMLLEIFLFHTEKKHLKFHLFMICAGSNKVDGNFPCLNWDEDNNKFDLGWYYSEESMKTYQIAEKFKKL